MDVFTLSKYLAELLDVALFEDVYINGLQVEGTRAISRIATAVSPSLFAIDEAARGGAEILLTHHALFLKKVGVPLSASLSKRVRSLYGADMHLLSFHLPLDAHREVGNNWPVLQELGCTTLEPFGKYSGMLLGAKGLCTPYPTEKLFSELQRYFGSPGVLFGAKKDTISSLAFVSGRAHSLLQDAIDQKIDCFITGTADESTWSLAQEGGVCVMAFGHYATEKKGVQLLGEHLARKFHVEHFFVSEKNPF